MKKNAIKLVIFIISAVCFGIHSRLIYNLGYFCDEYNFSPDIVYGGNFYLMLDWAEWALMALICLILLIHFIVSIIRYTKK